MKTITVTIPAHMTEREFIENVERISSPDWLANFWHIDDVLEVAPNLTPDQCREVLTAVEHNHDASVGINWDVLQYHADNIAEEK